MKRAGHHRYGTGRKVQRVGVDFDHVYPYFGWRPHTHSIRSTLSLYPLRRSRTGTRLCVLLVVLPLNGSIIVYQTKGEITLNIKVLIMNNVNI